MAKIESKTAKQERLEINKRIGRAKKEAKIQGMKQGKKKGYLYGILAAILGAVIIGGGVFAGITVADYVQNKDKSPTKEITVKALGNIVLLADQKIPTAEQVSVALLEKNPKIGLADFIIKDIKINGANGTAKVVSSHWWVSGSVEVTFTVSNS